MLATPFALGAAAQGRSGPAVKVGVIGPFSGPFSLFSRNFRIGIEAWMATQGGSAAGRKLEFLYRDLDGPSPAQARAIAQELIVKERVQYLGGVVFTPNAMAIAPLTEQARVPFVIFNATGSAVTARSPYAIRTSFTLPQVAAPLGTAAVARGAKRVAVAVSDYAPGADTESAFRKTLEAAGGVVAESVHMPLRTMTSARSCRGSAARVPMRCSPSFPPDRPALLLRGPSSRTAFASGASG